MISEYASQIAVGLLVLWLGVVVALGLVFSVLLVGYARRKDRARQAAACSEAWTAAPAVPTVFDHPCRWLAVKSSNLPAVQQFLGLHNASPCSWEEGVSHLEQGKLFVSPPIQGWILIVGDALPDATEDVDKCYRFFRDLAREFGVVQFFQANRVVNHHGWVWAERQRIVRAYIWAGSVLWNQNEMTVAERELNLQCFDYGETPPWDCDVEKAAPNAERVCALAARWSLDPTALGAGISGFGVTGERISTPGV